MQTLLLQTYKLTTNNSVSLILSLCLSLSFSLSLSHTHIFFHDTCHESALYTYLCGYLFNISLLLCKEQDARMMDDLFSTVLHQLLTSIIE
jgi:hypothetical protein